MKCEHIFGASASKKVVPAQTDRLCEYFYNVNEETGYIFSCKNTREVDVSWGYSFGREICSQLASF